MRSKRERLVLILVTCVCLVRTTGAEANDRCVPGPAVHGGGIEATPEHGASDIVTIASLNMAGRAGIADVLAHWIHERSVDVLLLQEVGHASSDGAAFVTTLSERFGRGFVYAPADLSGDGQTQGLGIGFDGPATTCTWCTRTIGTRF